MSGYWTGIISILCINIVAAYGVYLPVATGQLNLGAAGFQAVGAYVAGYLSATFGLALGWTILAAALAGGLVGGLIAIPMLRMRGVYMVLATFAFGEVVAGIIINSETLGGAMGMPVPGYIEFTPIVLITVFVVLVVAYLMTTRLGLAMRSIHDDEVVADLMGVNVRAVQVFAFAAGGLLVGISGALYALHFNFVEAQNFDDLLSIYILLYVLLGGTQTFLGPLVGAVFFTLLPELLRGLIPAIVTFVESFGHLGLNATKVDESWRFVVLGLATILMMMFRPEGFITGRMMERLFATKRRTAATKTLGEAT